MGSGWDAVRTRLVVVVGGGKKRRGNSCTLFPHLGGGRAGPEGGIYLLKTPFQARLYGSVGYSARSNPADCGFNSCVLKI